MTLDKHTAPDHGDAFRFAEDAEGTTNLANDERLALFAVSISRQQMAGFGSYLDCRQVECPECGAPGFNSGWGFWAFACGGELLTDGESWDEPCGRQKDPDHG